MVVKARRGECQRIQQTREPSAHKDEAKGLDALWERQERC